MSRLIDADELLHTFDGYVGYDDEIEIINQQPTVIAIPIDKIEQARREIEFADDTTYGNYKKIVLSVLDKLIAESEG